jgi:hypothetical protein
MTRVTDVTHRGVQGLRDNPTFWTMWGTPVGRDLGQARRWSAARQGRRCHVSEVPRRSFSRPGGVAWSLQGICRNRRGRLGTGWTSGTT